MSIGSSCEPDQAQLDANASNDLDKLRYAQTQDKFMWFD